MNDYRAALNLSTRQAAALAAQGETGREASLAQYFFKLGTPALHAAELARRVAIVADTTGHDEYVRNFRICRMDDLEAIENYEMNRDTDYCAYDELVTLNGVMYNIGCSWGD